MFDLTMDHGPSMEASPPLLDRQIMNLVEPSNNYSLYLSWSKQCSKNAMAFLSCIQAFVLIKPNLPSPANCPHSQYLRSKWKELLYGNVEYAISNVDNEADSDEFRVSDEPYATGLCCASCLRHKPENSSGLLQLIDFANDEEMYNAMMKLRKHIETCPFAQSTLVSKKATLSIIYESDIVAIKAFARWFCDYIHENDVIEKGLQIPPPSIGQCALASSAAARYLLAEEESNKAFQDIEAAIAQACCKSRKGSLLASDLTNVPSQDSLTDNPFYLQLLEHIEIVQITKDNPDHHANLLEEHNAESLVLFRCNCCHGESYDENSSAGVASKERPYVVHRPSTHQRTALVCDLIDFSFHHLQACPKLSLQQKQRILRVVPSPADCAFDSFVAFLQERFLEWIDYIEEEMKVINGPDNVVPLVVPLWRPLNELIEGSDSIRSTYLPLARQHATPCLPTNTGNYDVLEGFDGAVVEYIGNRQFRKLTGSLRDSFLSSSDSECREAIVAELCNTVHRKRGKFWRLNSDGVWTQLLKAEAADRCRSALEKGFVRLLARGPRHGSIRPGCNVLEVEIAPRYDLLSGKKRALVATKLPTDEDHVQNSTAKRLHLETSVRAVADV